MMITGIVLIVAGVLLARWPLTYHRQMTEIRARASERGQAERLDMTMNRRFIRLCVRVAPIVGWALIVIGVVVIVALIVIGVFVI